MTLPATLKELLGAAVGPSISIYQPAHGTTPTTLRTLVCFANPCFRARQSPALGDIGADGSMRSWRRPRARR